MVTVILVNRSGRCSGFKVQKKPQSPTIYLSISLYKHLKHTIGNTIGYRDGEKPASTLYGCKALCRCQFLQKWFTSYVKVV